MPLSLLRVIGFAILSLFLVCVSDVHAKCHVAKRKFIAVDLTDDTSTKKGMTLIEYVHVYPNGPNPPSTFRLSKESGAWKIPTVCKQEMEAKLSKADIALVLSAIPKQ